MTTPIAHRCPGLPDHTRAYVVELPEGVRLLVMADFERVDGPDTMSRLYPYCGGCGQSGRSIRAGKAPFKIAVHPISDACARKHGVSTSTIHRVRRGSTWAARS